MSNICLILFEPLKMSRFASVLLFMIIIEESLDFLIFAFVVLQILLNTQYDLVWFFHITVC